MKKVSSTEKMLLASLAFTLLLLAIRVAVTHETTFLFYVWNLFLAAIPLTVSRKLADEQKPGLRSYLLLGCWLLFFPNAPYILTDLFHFEKRPPMPYWFDLLLMINAAWTGLMLGLESLRQVEQFLSKHLKPFWVNSLISFSLLLCGYGIYLGRFLRFNSWDIVTAPLSLLSASFHHFVNPYQNKATWVFSVLFGVSLILFYYTIKAFNRLATGKVQ